MEFYGICYEAKKSYGKRKNGKPPVMENMKLYEALSLLE